VLPPNGVPNDLLNIFRMCQVFPLNLERRNQLLFKAYLENSFFTFLTSDVSDLISFFTFLTGDVSDLISFFPFLTGDVSDLI